MRGEDACAPGRPPGVPRTGACVARPRLERYGLAARGGVASRPGFQAAAARRVDIALADVAGLARGRMLPRRRDDRQSGSEVAQQLL